MWKSNLKNVNKMIRKRLDLVRGKKLSKNIHPYPQLNLQVVKKISLKKAILKVIHKSTPLIVVTN